MRAGAKDWVEEFPAHSARTRRFSLGAARSLAVAGDGSRVVFLRSGGPTDPVTALWVLDGDARDRSGRDPAERCVVDPARLDGTDSAEAGSRASLTQAERDRRERLRESAEGITSYSVDRNADTAVFALDGRAWLADLATDATVELPARRPVADPRLAPDASAVAYVCGRELRVLEYRRASGWRDRALTPAPAPAPPPSPAPEDEESGEDGTDVGWGLPEFIAAEEMHRFRGHWWSPDATSLLVTRVDASRVQRWYLSDPSDPSRAPREVGYPAAGTPNAAVTLWLLRRDGAAQEVTGWDTSADEYLVSVRWDDRGPALLTVQSRDQRRLRVLALDAGTARVRQVREVRDRHWVELVPGAPAWTPSGGLLTVEDSGDARRLVLDGTPLTPDDLQVRSVLDVGPEDALVTASRADPTEVHVLSVSWDGTVRQVSRGRGVHSAVRGGGTVAMVSATPERESARYQVQWGTDTGRSPEPTTIANVAAHSGAERLRAHHLTLGPRRLRSVLVLPSWYAAGKDGPLPVLLSPYGGPHAQLVLATAASARTPQWYAEHGFAVLVTDGRGTPGRGPGWEKAVAGDLATAVLEDQVDAVQAAAGAGLAELDLSRVGIRGWSFGGYLAALAVLRRPDVFHAAVSGAPVTDWRLYDTHYTERYLGQPNDGDHLAVTYQRSSLIDDALVPPDENHPVRPLLLIHGIADDNVYVAHTLRLSAALLAAGRPHSVLPMSGVTHFTPQVSVAENVSRFDLGFLIEALGARRPGGRADGWVLGQR